MTPKPPDLAATAKAATGAAATVEVAVPRESGSLLPGGPDGEVSRRPRFGMRRTAQTFESLKAYIAQLQRLILRHEDAITLLRIETTYVAHFRISTPEAIVTGIYQTAAGWKQANESKPESLDKPLRATLITCVFLELRTRTANLKQDQVEKLKALKWFGDATTTWSYLRWNAETKQLVRDEDKDGLKKMRF